jgi:uncharacterized Zn-binding protein involved in type VI secretion
MPFRSEKQRRYLWANEPKIAREWTEEYGSKPVKAKAGKYQELKHPEHDIKPVEHMEDKVSSKERVEKLLEDRKTKKDTKKKLAKEGPHYVPGWKPNLSVKAAEGELIRQKTRGTGAAVKGVEHYTMKGMPTAYQGQLIQAPTRGTGAAVKGTDHYIMPGMDAAKTGKLIKAKESKYIQKKKWWSADKLKSTVSKLKEDIQFIKDAKAGKLSPSLTEKAKKKILNLSIGEGYDKEAKGGHSFTPGYKPHLSVRTAKTGKMIKAKKGIWSGAASDMSHKPKGWDVKKISDKTGKKLDRLFRHRETGGWSPGAGKQYNKYLKNLKGMTAKATVPIKSKSFYFKDTPPASKLSKVLKKVGKRTGIGKAVAAATVVAGAYEAGKRKLFSLEKPSKEKIKKKIDKKSIGGETVVMKSGGGYIDELL